MDSYDESSNNSPMESPRPSSHHSRASSSASRISGSYNYNPAAFEMKGNRKHNGNGRNDYCKVFELEEGGYGDFYHDMSRRTRFFIAIIAFLLIFTFFCFIISAAALHYKPQLSIESLTVHNFRFQQGSDRTGVPTKMLTVNCSMQMTVYNPAPFFDIYVSSQSVKLMYSDLTVATGELKKYHEQRKSLGALTVNLQGRNVALYGAGPSFVENGKIPMKLVLEVKSCGYVIWKLVRTKHTHNLSCLVAIDSHNNNAAIKFEENACSYI